MLKLLLAVAGATATMGAQARVQPAAAQAQPSAEAALVGSWTLSDITQESDGLAIRGTDGRSIYSADRRLESSGILTLTGIGVRSGGAEPETAKFRIATTGSWELEGNLLHEKLLSVTVTPESDAPGAQAFASAMEEAIKQESESVSELLESTPNRIRMRDRGNGKEITLTRLP